uniref:RNA-directed RNA polymerase n=1 Tax=Leviviridae sp. TaxID=2027243 RepID=A0A514D9Q3_9VIRU|nr:MAG: RNA-dependent RNA polymerase [Leviviridae sp.]
MKSPITLARVVLNDIGDRVGISTHRDFETVSVRVKDEGFSFLAITLAQFCKDFERSLDRGYVGHDLFTHFAFKGSCPRFLGGFFDLIFDRGTGSLLDIPSVEAIYCIRQFTGMWSKIEIDCSEERIDRAYSDFLSSEIAVRKADGIRSPKDLSDFRRIASLLLRDVFTAVDSSVYNGEIVPKHGSGSTAMGIIGNEKYLNCTWTDRLEHLFPAREFLSSSYSLSFERPLQWLAPAQEPPVKVITVPKTLKTPRLIAMEPVHTQYVQQGLLESIVENVKRDNLLSRFITFEDQIPNQEMAFQGSLYGDLATLDLSAASDLVSNQLVREMTAAWPSLFEAVQASRSQVADVRGKVVRLSKFASMGSALCFPFESFVFLTLIFLAVERVNDHQLTRSDIRRLSGQVRAYGDDLIVPQRYVHEVVTTLTSFGLKVNGDKSFWTGKFRESCGKEYYNGFDVSIVKVRRELPTRPTHVDEIVSAVSFRNQAQSLYLFRTVEFMDSLIEKLIPFPTVLPTSSVLGKHSLDGSFETHRMCQKLHRPLVKGVKVASILPRDEIDSGAALLKFFLKRSDEPLERGHLRRAGRPSSVKLKAGYYSAY